MTRWLLSFALAAGLTLPGCSKTPPGPVDPATPAMVEVENQAFNDMNVYVLRGSQRVRLGTVPGNSKAVFEIPRSMVNQGIPIRFQADPIGGNRMPFSEEITVSPGETVVLRIPPA
jgi:hypothetical protein